MPNESKGKEARFALRARAHEEIQGGLWLIGIAVIVWQGWYWPGLLILVGLSAMVEGALRMLESKKP